MGALSMRRPRQRTMPAPRERTRIYQ
jgi:hypothetical protein